MFRVCEVFEVCERNQGRALLASTCISRPANEKYIRGRKSNTHRTHTAKTTTTTADTTMAGKKMSNKLNCKRKLFMHCGRCCGFCELATAAGAGKAASGKAAAAKRGEKRGGEGLKFVHSKERRSP